MRCKVRVRHVGEMNVHRPQGTRCGTGILQDKRRAKIKRMGCGKLGSLNHFLCAKLLPHGLQKLSVVVVAPVANCGMLDGFNEGGGHGACREALGKLGGICGGLVVLTASKEEDLTRVGVRARGRLFLFAVGQVDSGLNGGGGISAQKVVGDVDETGGEADGAAARTEALPRAHAEDIVLVREVETGSGVAGVEQDGEAGAAADATNNFVELVVNDGARNLVVDWEEGLVVAVALVAAGVDNLGAVAREGEPERVARAGVGNEPFDGLDDGAPVGTAACDVGDAGVLVGEDVKVAVAEAKLGLEQMVDVGDVADAAAELVASADVVDADEEGAFAAAGAEGAHDRAVRV